MQGRSPSLSVRCRKVHPPTPEQLPGLTHEHFWPFLALTPDPCLDGAK